MRKPEVFKAIFFDAGGTLFSPFPSVGEIYAQASFRFGTVCDPSVLEAEFHAAWQRRGGLSSLGPQSNEAKEKAWWHSLVEEVFRPYGGVQDFEDFFEGLYHSFEQRELWAIYPEVSGVLSFFRGKGYVLGIVSNWDSRLPRLVRNLQIAHYFDFILGSSACGATKPSRKIFEAALARSQTQPGETVHVGDNFEEDFLGARQVGITPFLLERDGPGNAPADLSPEARVRSLIQLKERLEHLNG